MSRLGYLEQSKTQTEAQQTKRKAISRELFEAAQDLPPNPKLSSQQLASRLQEISGLLEASPNEEIVTAARGLQEDLVKAFSLTRSPMKPPVKSRGAELYKLLCMDCHGSDGKAQTLKRHQLKIPPASFLDEQVIGSLSPYRVFTLLRFGLGEMPSFELSPSEDRWALAFYVFSFRHAGKEASQEALKSLPAGFPRAARELAALTDSELLQKLSGTGLSPEAQQEALRALRVLAPYQASQ
jgi:high-affinity iron transporter